MSSVWRCRTRNTLEVPAWNWRCSNIALRIDAHQSLRAGWCARKTLQRVANIAFYGEFHLRALGPQATCFEGCDFCLRHRRTIADREGHLNADVGRWELAGGEIA
jgi:hypothetical protein